MTVKKAAKAGQSPQPPVWEWMLAALGAILILGAIGVTLYRAATREDTPASFEIQIESTERSRDSYAVTFKIQNIGSHTAAAVSIEGTLTKGEEEEESSAATITYIPPNSERQATVFFSKDPKDFETKLRVTGYERP
ncbi:MAG: hypothetical protein WKF34_11960 [Pyrinomonadaceae bacterium]